MASGLPAVEITVAPIAAYAIDTAVGSCRGVVAIRDSGGAALLVGDDEMLRAQRELARAGLWYELSGAAGLAGMRQLRERFGTVVCIATSSGFKDLGVGSREHEVVEPSWDVVSGLLRDADVT